MPTYGLAQIESMEPSSRDAQDAKDFADLFIMSLKLVTDPNTNKQSCNIKVRNYDYETGEISPHREDEYNIRIRNLMVEAARVPRLAWLMNEIVVLTGLMYKECKIMEQIEAAILAEEDVSVLEMQLDAVRAQLYMPGVRRFLNNALELTHEATAVVE